MMSSEPPQRFSFMYQTSLLPSAQLILTPDVVGISKNSLLPGSLLCYFPGTAKTNTTHLMAWRNTFYSLTVLESRSLKSMSLSRARALLEALEQNPFLVFSSFGNCCHSLVLDLITLVLKASIFKYLFPPTHIAFYSVSPCQISLHLFLVRMLVVYI